MGYKVPQQYDVEFGEKVARSFVFLGDFVDKTDVRLSNVEDRVAVAFEQIAKLKNAKPKKFPLKTVLVFYGGMVIGGKLRDRAIREQLTKTYSESVEKLKKMSQDVKEGPSTRNDDPSVDISPEHDVTR